MRSLFNLYNDWRAKSRALAAFDKDLPRLIGIECVKVVKQNFQKQGYDSGAGIAPWKARSPKTNKTYDRNRIDSRGRRGNTGRNSTYRGSVYSSAKPLLMQTRNLYNSVSYTVVSKRVTIGVNASVIPYAKRMNEGGGGVPARKFMPTDSDKPNLLMLSRVKRKIEFEREKILKQFRR